MPKYTQDNRPMRVDTPLGKDQLLLTGFSGQEQIGQLYSFHVDLLAEGNTVVAFDKLLGKPMTVTLKLPQGKERFFNGIVSRFSEGEQVVGQNPGEYFTVYQAEIVPKFWVLTRRAQSRIFQHMNVPDILKQVLEELDVDYRLEGTFQPRDYCVQYRETDFNFASRMMEEEGIFFFFEHSNGSHKLVVTNAPSYNPVPEFPKAIYETVESGVRKEDRVLTWTKMQELRSGKYTLWDHCFELPHKHLDAEKTIQESVASGSVTHKLKVGGNDKLELYDYPGEYAQRFDGIDKGGGEQSSEVQKIFEDNARTVGIRMQEEAMLSMSIEGSSNCRQFLTGHKFTLERHFNADGDYLLTQIQHEASSNAYRSSQEEFQYANSFQCIPVDLPYRPPRVTPKPFVQGTQTAVVVGPSGEEIFTDKYSRVKVQFHWDRDGKNDPDSSCWVRVATSWAGKNWGVIHIPRIGQEVIVDFLEGDPDNPIIVGSVYNADTMPPYDLPGNRTQSGVKSRSSLGGGTDNFNEIRFEDKKGSEEVYVHAEKDQNNVVENDETTSVGHDRTEDVGNDEKITIGNNRTEKVGVDENITIGSNRTENVGANEDITIGSNRTEKVGSNETITIGSNRTETVGSSETINIGSDRTETVGANEMITITMTRTRNVGINDMINVAAAQEITVGGAQAITVGAAQAITVGAAQETSVGLNQSNDIGNDQNNSIGKNRSSTVGDNDTLKVGKTLAIEAGDQVAIKTGNASILMKKDGTIQIKGKDITIDGSGEINVKASKDITMKGDKIKQN